MPRLTDAERLIKLVRRQIRGTKSNMKKKARSDETHSKIIAGALALEHAEKNPGSEFAKIMLRLLDEYTRPHERHLFPNLPPREAQEAEYVPPKDRLVFPAPPPGKARKVDWSKISG